MRDEWRRTGRGRARSRAGRNAQGSEGKNQDEDVPGHRKAVVYLDRPKKATDSKNEDSRTRSTNQERRSPSAIITAVRWVFARGITGMMDASTTERPSIPMNRHRGSTTADGSSGAPIRHVPEACT